MLQSKTDLLPPDMPLNYQCAWAQYSVLAKDGQHRDELQRHLKEAGIPTAVYYPKPLHLQTAYSYLGYQKGDFAVSEDYADRIFSLPMHPYLSEAAQETIVDAMANVK